MEMIHMPRSVEAPRVALEHPVANGPQTKEKRPARSRARSRLHYALCKAYIQQEGAR